jgi:hypothetical protein
VLVFCSVDVDNLATLSNVTEGVCPEINNVTKTSKSVLIFCRQRSKLDRFYGKWMNVWQMAKFRKVLVPKISELRPRDPGVFVHQTSLLVLQVFCQPRAVDSVTELNVALRFIVHCNGKICPISGHEGPEGGRSIVLLFLLPRPIWGGWSTPRPGRFTPGENPTPIVLELGRASGPVCIGAQNFVPAGIRSPDRPARSIVTVPTTLSRPTWVIVHP